MTHGAVRWKRCSLLDLGLDLRHELDRARAGADHGDALAVEVVVVVPGGRVEERALELAQARDRRAASARAAARRRRSAPGRVSWPLEVSSRQRPASASQRALSTSQPKRTCSTQALVGRDPAQVVAGSRAAARTSSSSRGWARTRTSRGGSARRSDSPGRCSRARCRRRRRARSRITKSSRPARFSRRAIARPEKPLPTIAISVCCSFRFPHPLVTRL